MSVKSFLVKWKVRLGAAGGIFSMVGIPYLVALQVQSQLQKVGVVLPFIYILIFGLIVLFVIGWGYDHYGFFSSENGYCLTRNEAWERRNEK